MNIKLLNNGKSKNHNSNNSLTLISKKPEETRKIGKKIGSLLKRGDLIALNGDLGAGKTCFVQGIASGINCSDKVSSPSFSIIKEYSGRLPIYHFDLYRLNQAEEIEELGYEEYFYGDGIVLIEWADKIKKYLPKELLLVKIKIEEEYCTRKIIFKPIGKRYIKLVEGLIDI